MTSRIQRSSDRDLEATGFGDVCGRRHRDNQSARQDARMFIKADPARGTL